MLIGFGDRYEKETKALGLAGLMNVTELGGPAFQMILKEDREAAKVEARGKGRVIEWLHGRMTKASSRSRAWLVSLGL